MRVSSALTIFTHLLALAGFLSISLTGSVGLPLAVIFSAALVLSFCNERFGKDYYLGHGLSNALALLLVVYIGFSVFFLGRELFRGIIEFLILLQALKLLCRKRMRDVMQIYALSFFQFIAGTVITVNFTFSAAFVVYMAVAVCAVIVFEMRRSALESDAPAADDPRLVTPPFLGTAFLLSVCILLTSVLIFVSVPRLRGSYFSSGLLSAGELRSGFSDEVRLGRVGEIKLDGSPVMMVRVLGRDISDVPYPLYWRGVALDEFDGVSWRSGDLSGKTYRPDSEGELVVGSPAADPKDMLGQEIITEPIDTDVLFSANVPVTFSSVPGGRVSALNDSYSLTDRMSYRIKYRALSNIHTPSPRELRSDRSTDDEDMEAYLQLPRLSDRVRDLALNITSIEDNRYDKALSVKRYLLTNYSYTRTLERGATEYPIEEFLFDRKEGHCEYFATAMVVLLREAGVPSRIVNGFVGGTPNGHGNFYLVRESDAHSWVEVYFPGHGWVSFDPTPEGRDTPQDGFLAAAASYIDYLRFRWNRYVIDFSERDQMRLLAEAGDKWRFKGKTLLRGQDVRSLLDKRAATAAVVVLLFIWFASSRPDIGSLLRLCKKSRGREASALYSEALRFLSRKGFPKPDSMTAGEYSDSLVRSSFPGAAAMKTLTGKYLALRFGGSGEDEELKALRRLLLELKRAKA